jgi:hypothetical protein
MALWTSPAEACVVTDAMRDRLVRRILARTSNLSDTLRRPCVTRG